MNSHRRPRKFDDRGGAGRGLVWLWGLAGIFWGVLALGSTRPTLAQAAPVAEQAAPVAENVAEPATPTTSDVGIAVPPDLPESLEAAVSATPALSPPSLEDETPLAADRNPADHWDAARRAVAAKEIDVAFLQYEKALAGWPNDLRLGTEYRQLGITHQSYARVGRYLERLARQSPDAPNLWLNLGYAQVDKVPVEGPISQMMLANAAIKYFSRSLELEESWLGLYTRGNSYVFWPPVFGRTPLGIADLARATELAKEEESQPYHVLAWVALGDGFWRAGDRVQMREVWRRGLELFPNSPELEERLGLEEAALDALLKAQYDVTRRVPTDLAPILGVEDSP